MRVGVLGPLEVTDEQGRAIDIGGPQPRLLLAALVAAGDRPASVDSLIELLWPHHPPPSASRTLQSYVSRLRRVLATVDGQVVLEAGGYRLAAPALVVDVRRFDELLATGNAELAAGRPTAARDALAEALALWRGPALVELTDVGASTGQALELEERRLAAVEARIDADCELRRHEQTIGELRTLTAEHPLRESLYARLALVLYRSSRQSEALGALAELRNRLREELGLEMSRPLAELETAILNQDPALDAPPSVLVRPAGDVADAFVGRAPELDALLASYNAASDDAQFVVIEGEPGIGKTRLAEELATLAARRGSQTAWARSSEIGATPALWPWFDVLRTFLTRVEQTPPELAELLAGAVPLRPGQSIAGQLERFDAVAAILERAGGQAPAVVVLDDLQWFDPASLDLLRFLITRITRGVLLVATVRTLEIGRADGVTDALGALARRRGSRRLRLRGLSLAETGQLLGTTSGPGPSPELATRIHGRADGNPFYTIELARLLGEEAGDDDVPATVRDTIRRRLDQMAPETLDVLTVAAVVSRDVDVALLAEIAALELGECAERLDEAARHRLLVADPRHAGRLRFAHALVREVLVEELTPLRRARLHVQVADALEANPRNDGDIEAVADHLWHAAALGVDERAAAALERAADRAVGRVAYTSAEDMLRRAVQLRQASGRVADPALRRAQLDAQLRLLAVMQATRYFSGTDRALLRNTQDLALELGRHDVSRELTWSEWAAVSRSASVADAEAIARRYRERWAEDPNPAVRASIAIMSGVTRWSHGEIGAAVRDLDDAAALLADETPAADALERGLPLIGEVFRLYCHSVHGTMTPEQALARFDDMLAALPAHADGRHQPVYAFACRTAAVHGRWDALSSLVQRSGDLGESDQFAFFGGQLLLYRALVEARRGDFDAALGSFAEGRARFRAVGGRTGVATCQALLAELLARAGRVGDASVHAAGARQEIVDTGEEANESAVLIAQAAVAAARGEADAAKALFETAVRSCRRHGAHALGERARRVAAELGVDLPLTDEAARRSSS